MISAFTSFPFALSLSKGLVEPQAKPLRFALCRASTSLSLNGLG